MGIKLFLNLPSTKWNLLRTCIHLYWFEHNSPVDYIKSHPFSSNIYLKDGLRIRITLSREHLDDTYFGNELNKRNKKFKE